MATEDSQQNGPMRKSQTANTIIASGSSSYPKHMTLEPESTDSATAPLAGRRVPAGVSATTDYLRLGPPVSTLGPRKTIAGSNVVSSPSASAFVHSHLDNTLADALLAEKKRRAKAKARAERPPGQAGDSSGSETDTEGSDDAQSLTRQLAETAVSVREMSKQLGRARVKSSVQSIMIITKAKDPHLVKLTRELAIYLMTSCKANGRERGAIVYVDTQLQKSKRFNAAGIERDHPELFKPVQSSSRRSSKHSSSVNLPNLDGMDREKRIAHLRQALTSTPITSPKQTSPIDANATSGAATPNGERYNDEGQLRYWTAEMCTRSPHLFDFVVTLGGDGTVLFASWLFQRIVPPVIPFALGSLGFLTNFDFSEYENVMSQAVKEGVRVNLRMRFTCTVYRAIEGDSRKAIRSAKTGEIFMADMDKGEWEAIEGSHNAQRKDDRTQSKDREVRCFSTHPVETFEVLNDLVVDRGPSPYVSLLELFGDEHHMTTVQADGLCVATPTGSTAYSLSAGGSLVHPEIPAILISPICPHTLSFRPMLLPDSMELRICVPYNSRSTAWASFDGRGRVELKQGDHIKITASQYPFPTVCADKQSTDWFHAIGRTLKWNERQRQKSFVVVEEARQREDQRDPKTMTKDRKAAEKGNDPDTMREAAARGQDEQRQQSEDDDDDSSSDVDIDDMSSASSFVEGPTKPVNPHGMIQAGDDADEDSRFAGERPHPPKVSQRHSSSYAARLRGEDGDRDDLRMPLEDKRKKDTRHHHKSNSGTARPPSAPPATGDMRPVPSTDASSRKQELPSGHAYESQRAFAVVGEDYSDASLSDGDNS